MKDAETPTPELLTSHDHGNCALCDQIEANLATANEKLARLRELAEDFIDWPGRYADKALREYLAELEQP